MSSAASGDSVANGNFIPITCGTLSANFDLDLYKSESALGKKIHKMHSVWF